MTWWQLGQLLDCSEVFLVTCIGHPLLHNRRPQTATEDSVPLLSVFLWQEFIFSRSSHLQSQSGEHLLPCSAVFVSIQFLTEDLEPRSAVTGRAYVRPRRIRTEALRVGLCQAGLWRGVVAVCHEVTMPTKNCGCGIALVLEFLMWVEECLMLVVVENPQQSINVAGGPPYML